MVASNNWRGLESRVDLEERILDVATLGDAMFQVQVSTILRNCYKRVVNAIASVRFVSWTGDAYYLDRVTPGPDAIWIDDTEQQDCSDEDCGEPSFVRESFPFKCLFKCGSVTRKAIARGRPFFDVLGRVLTQTTEDALYTLEKAMFQGNITGDPASKEITGLFRLGLDYNGSNPALPNQVLLGDGSVLVPSPGPSTPGDLTLKLLDELLDLVKDGNKVIFVSRAGRRLIRSLLQGQQRFNDTAVIEAGFEVEAYFGAAIVTTDGIPDTINIIDDGAGNPEIEDLTTGATTAIVAINTGDDGVFFAELTPWTVEPVALCTRQRQKFEGYWDGSLVLGCPQGLALLLNVNPEC